MTDSNTAPGDSIDLTPELLCNALRRAEYRICLDHLNERYGAVEDGETMRLPRGELIATIRSALDKPGVDFGGRAPTRPSDPNPDRDPDRDRDPGHARDRAVAVVYHMALPRLADLGFLDYDTDRHEVVVSPRQAAAVSDALTALSLVKAVCEPAYDSPAIDGRIARDD